MGDIKPFDQDSMEWCFFRDFYKMCRKNWHRDGRDITEMCCEITGLAADYVKQYGYPAAGWTVNFTNALIDKLIAEWGKGDKT